MLLAIDCGNSYLKWGLHTGSEWITKDSVCVDELSLLKSQWRELKFTPSAIIISNVKNNDLYEHLSSLVSIWSVKPHWISSLPFQCGVTNGYIEASQLGSDRWASLIAVKHLVNQPCLVINVGTAMTIDAISKTGQFFGGIILPGPDLILQSLNTHTDQLSDKEGCYQDFPTSTINATFSGLIHSTIGSIDRMRNIFSSTLNHSVEHCIISGGGAYKLLPFISDPVTVIDNLVLEGLVIIAAETCDC